MSGGGAMIKGQRTSWDRIYGGWWGRIIYLCVSVGEEVFGVWSFGEIV